MLCEESPCWLQRQVLDPYEEDYVHQCAGPGTSYHWQFLSCEKRKTSKIISAKVQVFCHGFEMYLCCKWCAHCIIVG